MVKGIRQQLKAKKLKYIPIPGDGNCQFRAIAHALSAYNIVSKAITYKSLRSIAIDYIKKHKAHYKNKETGKTGTT